MGRARLAVTVTVEDRLAAGRIAGQLARAAREVVRAVQADEAGEPGALVHLLRAELDVEGVRDRLRRVRSRAALAEFMAEGRGAPAREGRGVPVPPARSRDAAGRYTKVQGPGPG